jgi:hypothetical protein
MVPSIITILQQLTGEWAMLLPPDAILAACGRWWPSVPVL